jgi:hypothetical protein
LIIFESGSILSGIEERALIQSGSNGMILPTSVEKTSNIKDCVSLSTITINDTIAQQFI